MADGLLSVEFVATDGLIWKGDAVSVLVRTVEGDIGVLYNHAPLMASLVPHGAEVVGADGVRTVIAIDSGFLSVFENNVSVLSAYGELAKEISVEQAEIELAGMYEKIQSGEATSRERRQYRRLQSQVRAGRKYKEMENRSH